jgi:hypothetical protein
MHCACGATRDAPVALTIVSCVACGAAMSRSIPIQYATPPTRTLVTTATFATQLLGTFAFALALVWIVALRVTAPPVIAVLLAGAAAVFAGGHAHRGNVIALGICTAFDLVVATFLLLRLPVTEAFAWPALARLHVHPRCHRVHRGDATGAPVRGLAGRAARGPRQDLIASRSCVPGCEPARSHVDILFHTEDVAQLVER